MNPNSIPRMQASFNPSNIMNPNSIPRVQASFNPSNIMNPNSIPRVQASFNPSNIMHPNGIFECKILLKMRGTVHVGIVNRVRGCSRWGSSSSSSSGNRSSSGSSGSGSSSADHYTHILFLQRIVRCAKAIYVREEECS
jgi:hypothetical protein